MRGECSRNNAPVDEALDRIEKAIKSLERCEGRLTADGYKALRRRLGHLMDTLYKVGDTLSKST